jgi:2-methylaconitate cis-trans-isomerase PrpF
VIAYIAAAEGAPCPTLVIDAREVPAGGPTLDAALAASRRQLVAAGYADVLKIALIAPATHPMFDFSYRFVQCVPRGDMEYFDHIGSCGHSIVASTLVANELGWIPQLAPGHRVRVQVENNGDTVVCEVDELHRTGGNVTVHFLHEPAVDPRSFLVTGHPVDTLAVGDTLARISLVSMGNPYVFVRARDLGVRSQDELFADDQTLFEKLVALRRAAGARWGWPPTSAFPKIAAVDHFQPGRIAVRAVSVPTWHPTLALTGATCLAVASAIPGTVTHDIVEEAGCAAEAIHIDTPAGVVTGCPNLVGPPGSRQLAWVSVSGKRARHIARLSLTLPTSTPVIEENVA